MTLEELIASSADALDAAGVSFGHGTTNAYDEAAWLVLWQLGRPLDSDIDDDAVAQALIAPAQLAQVQALVQKRIRSRVPAAYLTGEAWLQGVPFHVDERCIVPRSLIGELLATGALDYWLPEGATRLLDLCTGGASLAVLAALAYPELQIDAVDISTDALAVARMNVDRHGLQQRICLLQGDGLAASHGPYDMVLCNPPYVNSASMAQLPPEYRAEPSLALAGGNDGMDFVRSLLQDARAVMSEAAVLVLEIGHERPNFETAFATLDVVWLDTSAGHDQVCVVTRDALFAHSQGGQPPML